MESARAWSTAQPATGRAHLAMVDALLVNRQYADAMAEVARFRVGRPHEPGAALPPGAGPLRERRGPARGRGARSRRWPRSPRGTSRARKTRRLSWPMSSRAPTCSPIYGDLASAARVLELADEIRTEVLSASMPRGCSRGATGSASMQGTLYGGAGVPVAALRADLGGNGGGRPEPARGQADAGAPQRPGRGARALHRPRRRPRPDRRVPGHER